MSIMKIYLVYCLIILLRFCSAISMESPHSGKIKINQWEDAKPFAGKIIAYSTNYDFYLSENGCSFADAKIKYGYIPNHLGDWLAIDGNGQKLHTTCNKDRGFGYNLHQLMVSGKTSFSYKPLVNFRLKEAQLEVRCISFDELVSIQGYIKKRLAYFESSRSSTEDAFVQEALGCLQAELKENGLQESDLSNNKIT